MSFLATDGFTALRVIGRETPVLAAGVQYLLGNHDKAELAVRTSAGYLKEFPGMLHTAEHEPWSALVAAADDAGHLHIAGLAHELAAAVHTATGHPDAARRIAAARRYYDRWGATLLSATVEARISA